MVTTDANLQWRRGPDRTSWANRVLLLSLAGIFFLTLYPFRFAHQESSRFLFPFSLNGFGKGNDVFSGFLNVLLFIPFGFGLREKLRECGKSRKAALLTAYVCGALVSYFVEILQIYIPLRDSGWSDVITNSSGALIGAVLFEFAGAAIVWWCGARERKIASWLTLPKIGVFVALCTTFWCTVAGPLQRQTKIRSWTEDSFLTLGKSASLHTAPGWKGEVLELNVWNRAVPPEQAGKITASLASGQAAGSLAAYRLSGPGPFQDIRNTLPSLDWASKPVSSGSDGAVFDGKSWLISVQPVPTLASSIESTGQFALRVICRTGPSLRTSGRIVSLSSPTGRENLALSQVGSALEFWFRDPLTRDRPRMTWIAPRLLAPDQTRDILLSFNGTAASLFVDGRDYGHAYEFGPGAALAHYFRHIKTEELPGYSYIFYAIIFLPMGGLLAFAWRKIGVRAITRLYFMVGGWLLPAVIFELVVAHAANRSISPHNIFFAAMLTLAGSLWMNADRSHSRAMHCEYEPASVR